MKNCSTELRKLSVRWLTRTTTPPTYEYAPLNRLHRRLLARELRQTAAKKPNQ